MGKVIYMCGIKVIYVIYVRALRFNKGLIKVICEGYEG